MMKRIALALALLAVSLLLLNAGCYTVLQHPTGGSVVQEGSYYRTCADCHADAAYYRSPCWSDNSWGRYDHQCDDHDESSAGPEVETGTRHLWGTGGWAPGGWGFTKPGSGTRRPPPPPANEPQKKEKQKKKDEDKNKEKETEKEKDERNLWKKPKKGF